MKRMMVLIVVITAIFLVSTGGVFTANAATLPIRVSDSYKTGVYYTRLCNTLDTYANYSMRERFLKVALSQIGYNSNSNSNNLSGTGDANGYYQEYGYGLGLAYTDWCAEFVSWSAAMAGVPSSIIPRTAGAGTFRSVATAHRLWSDDFSTYIDYKPEPGDIILNMPDGNGAKYNSWTLTAHVAIIAEVGSRASDGGWNIRTVERLDNTVGLRETRSTAYSWNSNGTRVHFYQMIIHPSWPEDPDVTWANVTADQTSVPVGTRVNFSVSSDVSQGENGYYYDLYLWDQASYSSGGNGTWVGVSANSASYVFNAEDDYYVRFRVHNTTHDLYSEPLLIHVFGQTVSLRITSGATGSANIVNAGGQVDFEFVTDYTQGQNGCYFDMYIWDYQSYLQGANGVWVGMVGGKSSYVFNSAGIYFVRAHIHNDTMSFYSEPLIVRVPTVWQDDFYALILNRACWMPISQVEGSTAIALKYENRSSKMVWRFQLQNNSTYSISSCYDGKMLEMHNGIREAGTQLTAHDTYWGGAYQQWYMFPFGDGFILQSAHYGGEGWVMDLRNNNPTDGNAIQINSMNGTTAQVWAIYKGDEVQLSGPQLQVVPSNSLTGTSFSWPKSYGATSYNLRIYKDTLYEGQDFTQWSVSPGCTAVLPAGNYVAYVDAVNYHLYKAGPIVQFSIPEAYAVNFDLCGGSGVFNTLYKEKGQILMLPENQPTREGFSFVEWNTKADGSGESIHPGDGYITDAELVLYAQWVEQTKLYLPVGLKIIEAGAFEGISAEIVYIPEGCTSIGSRAFAYCPNLICIIVSDLSGIDIADDALEGTNAVFIEK